MNAKQRAAVYVVAGAVMAILIAYDVVSESVAPLWLSLSLGFLVLLPLSQRCVI